MAFTLMLCMAGYGQSGNWKTTNNPAQFCILRSVLYQARKLHESYKDNRSEATRRASANTNHKTNDELHGYFYHESAGVEADDLIASAVESLSETSGGNLHR